MKNMIKYLPACLLVLLSGCKDMFDNEVPQFTVVDNAIYDETSAENVLRGVYSYLISDGTSSSRHDFDSRYILDGAVRVGLLDMQRSDEKELAQLKTTVNSSITKERWTACARIINAANLVIEGVNHLDGKVLTEVRKKEIEGEARFMRAWAQLYLMKYYSWFWDINSEYGPLMRREPTNVSNTQIARSTVREGYRLILEDLNFALLNAPDFTTPYRASKGVAKAYKIEVLLMRGEVNDYADAAQLAYEVIHNYGFKLEDSYEAVFENGYNSKELMFTRWLSKEMTHKADGEGGSMKRTFGGGQWPSAFYLDIIRNQANSHRYEATMDSIFYEAADKRKKVVCWKKLWKEDGNCPVYYMRLGQMHLYRAEALARTNAAVQDVIEELNVLRRRSGDQELDAALYDGFMQEDILRLVYEEMIQEVGMENGSEYTMAVRLPYRKGYPLLYLYNENFAWDRICWPIPQDELKFNMLIVQNPVITAENSAN